MPLVIKEYHSRQLVPWGVNLSVETSATLIVCSIVMRNCFAICKEEGGDDVKSAWRLCLGPHTSYNGVEQRVAKPRGGANPIKTPPSSDCGLQLARMKLDLVVIADQQAAVNTFSLFVQIKLRLPFLESSPTRGPREAKSMKRNSRLIRVIGQPEG